MKNTIITGVLCLIIGLGIGYLLFRNSSEISAPTPSEAVSPSAEASPEATLAPSPSAAPSEENANDLIATGQKAAELIKSGDFQALSEMIHPDDGVYFTPYSRVDVTSDMHFSAEQVKNFKNDKTEYLWGITDGEGAPINLTPVQYFEKYVFDQDYTAAPVIGRNHVVMSGNSIENVKEAYPDCQFIDFNFPGIDEQYGGMDWCTLRIVFRDYKGSLKIVGIIHAQWTI